MTDASNKTPLLEIHNLTKTFPGVPALSSVDFTMYPGEVHAVLGENGAGKSTLIKVITGVYKKDSGSIKLQGKEIEPGSPYDAQLLGISTVYQEINLIPTLSVAENIFLGRQPKRFGMIDHRATVQKANQLIETYDIHIDTAQPLGSFSVAIQQIAAIARGVDLSAKILILDEPTSSLDIYEVGKLFSVIRSLKEKGIGILLVTHFLDQVYEISDRITVLRNGFKIGEHLTNELPRMQLVSEMLGKELVKDSASEASHKPTQQDVYLQVRGLGKRGEMEPFDLDIHKGEIVSLAGLLGSGRTETAQLIFGITRKDKGKMTVQGTELTFNSPRNAILHGFALCPEDRKAEGIIGDLTVRENIILALQAKRGWHRYLPRKKQEELAEGMIRALHIATPDSQKVVRELSGGNQQKVILARWLVSEPEFLILDEPTRGIDIGAHAEVISIIKDLCAKGMPLLVISSELAEMVDYSDRVVVLRDRKKVTELQHDEISQNSIMKAIAES